MFTLTANITIGEVPIEFPVTVKGKSSWEMLTDTAELTIARAVTINNRPIEQYFKVGDPVRISTGYDGRDNLRFIGYVTRIVPGVPVVIMCEDDMWPLKRNTLSKMWRSTTLPEVMQYLAANTPAGSNWKGKYSVDNVELGPLKVDRLSTAAFLGKLQEAYGLYAFFRYENGEPVLVVGKPYSKTNQRDVKVDMYRNIPEQDVEFVRADERKVRLEAINILPSGARQKTQLGDTDGEARTRHYYNTPNYVELATEELARMKYDGFTGGLTLYGEPFVEHGDIEEVVDSVYPERGGRYYIDGVEWEWGINGYRQITNLGPKAA